MGNPYGAAGESIRQTGNKKSNFELKSGIFPYDHPDHDFYPAGGGVRGRKGRELMSPLNDSYAAMHDVVSPYGNIDHIVYDSRGNIFMIETKSHGGRVASDRDQLLLNGQAFEKDIVEQCLANRSWLKEKLEAELKVKAWITPVLVFTNADVEFGEPIRGVYYTNKKCLPGFFQKMEVGSPAGLKLWEMKKMRNKLK